MFKCSKCGLCCKSIGGSVLYSDLDDGNGVCRFWDEESGLCTIYDSRPLKCRVDDSYEALFADVMSIEDYYQLNYQACKIMQKREGF